MTQSLVPLNPDAPEPAVEAPSEELTFTPSDFLNYELSWLDFNWRVLREATHPLRNLLLDRIRFLAIASANLDEFIQKRIGGLKRHILAGMRQPGIDGLSPETTLQLVRRQTDHMLKNIVTTLFRELLPQLSNIGVELKRYKELNSKERLWVDQYFAEHIYPILTPLAVDPARPFPFISNKSLSLAIELTDAGGRWHFARLKVPPSRPRFVSVDAPGRSARTVLIPIEEIITENLDTLFTGMTIKSVVSFRVLRNAEVSDTDEDADDILELISQELRDRKYAPVVCLLVDQQISSEVKTLLAQELEVGDEDIYLKSGILALADLFQIADLPGLDEHRQQPWNPKPHPIISIAASRDDRVDMFELIRRGDLLVHHPYHSFESSVVNFVRQAAADPKVLAIKQTLYRTTADSKSMRALIEAAESGKQVAVLVELKARFDEERNIELAQLLEKSGVHVTYGLVGLKTHCKTTLVVREEDGGIRRYFHIGTGNYNPTTSRLYEDLGLFSCDPVMGEDLSRLFNYLTGYAPQQHYDKILVAPVFWRRRFLELIDFEIAQARSGATARIRAKMNGLEDRLIIEKLYAASAAGVQIDLFVRGVCRLIPGHQAFSQNIRVHSIVGRFLEHSRIYHFHHAGEDQYFIGSGDLMRRNLDRRVEVVTPILQSQLRGYLDFYFEQLAADVQQTWMMQSDGTYRPKWERETGTSVHHAMMEHAEKHRSPIGWHPYQPDDTLF